MNRMIFLDPVSSDENPKTLSRKDWLLLFVVFAVSEILGIWGLHMVRHSIGKVSAIGLSLLFAASASVVCAYFWRIKSHWHASKVVQISAIVLLLIIAAVAFLFGGEFNGQALLYVAGHGMPNWSRFGLQSGWVWVFISALGLVYIQIWTLVRKLLNTPHRS